MKFFSQLFLLTCNWAHGGVTLHHINGEGNKITELKKQSPFDTQAELVMLNSFNGNMVYW